jgi:hypothetical protein
MTKDRQAVVLAVLKGELDESHITDEELLELEEALMDAIVAKKQQAGFIAFSGVDSSGKVLYN